MQISQLTLYLPPFPPLDSSQSNLRPNITSSGYMDDVYDKYDDEDDEDFDDFKLGVGARHYLGSMFPKRPRR